MELLQVLGEQWALRALIASTLVGTICGVIGAFMVLRNMSLIGDAISHAILPGIFVAFVVVGYSSTGFFIGTLIAALISAVAMTWIQDNVKTKNDAAIGIIFTFMFSIGVIGISYLNNQKGVHLDLKDFLFGTILGISNEDIMITLMVTIYSLISIVIFYRYLFISTFQPIIASTMGISVKAMHYFLMLLLSFAIVASLRTVGIILVVAMLITPSSTALLLSNRLKSVLIISGLIGFLSAAIGLVLAIIFDTTPGPAMCVVVTIFYLLAAFFSKKNGLFFKYLRKRQLRKQIEKEDIVKYLVKNGKLNPGQVQQMANKLGLKQVKSRMSLLVKEDLISLEKNAYSLTSKGKSLGQDLVRAHRLWETFLVDKVGLKSDEIHEDAEKYEHLLDQNILDQLDAKLGYPKLDPHGSPIPTGGSKAKKPLLVATVAQEIQISTTQISDHVESQLWSLGLIPDMDIVLSAKNDEYVTLEFNGKKIKVSRPLAEKININ